MHKARIVLLLLAAYSCAAQTPTPELIKSTDTNPAIQHSTGTDVVLRPAKLKDAPLLLWIPGTSGHPERYLPFLNVIASQGYRVIGLPYNTAPSITDSCAALLDPACPEQLRTLRTWGSDVSTPAPVAAIPSANVPTAESITGRLVALLQLLATGHPEEGWQTFLTSDNKPVWSKIAVAGQSQGAGMAALIAKKERVPRVILFSNPADTTGGLDNPQLARWLTWPSATPMDRWYAERNSREPLNGTLTKTYAALKIPPAHIHVFSLDLPPDAKQDDPGAYHMTNIQDPRYIPEWKLLFGTP